MYAVGQMGRRLREYAAEEFEPENDIVKRESCYRYLCLRTGLYT